MRNTIESGTFEVGLTVPEPLSVALQKGIPALNRAALEGIAVKGFRLGILSLLDIRQLFGFASRWEAQEFLAMQGAWPSYTEQDIAQDAVFGMKVVISDTSVLCYLALIERLPLLEALYTQGAHPGAGSGRMYACGSPSCAEVSHESTSAVSAIRGRANATEKPQVSMTARPLLRRGVCRCADYLASSPKRIGKGCWNLTLRWKNWNTRAFASRHLCCFKRGSY